MDRIQHLMIQKKDWFLVLRTDKFFYLSQEVFNKGWVDLSRFGGKGMETVIIFKKTN